MLQLQHDNQEGRRTPTAREPENAGRLSRPFTDDDFSGPERLAQRQVYSPGDAQPRNRSGAPAQLSAQLFCALPAAEQVNERGGAGARLERGLLYASDERRG